MMQISAKRLASICYCGPCSCFYCQLQALVFNLRRYRRIQQASKCTGKSALFSHCDRVRVPVVCFAYFAKRLNLPNFAFCVCFNAISPFVGATPFKDGFEGHHGLYFGLQVFNPLPGHDYKTAWVFVEVVIAFRIWSKAL